MSVIKTREGFRVIDFLRKRRARLVSTRALKRLLWRNAQDAPGNPWQATLAEIASDMAAAVGDGRLPAQDVVDWIYESADAYSKQAPGHVNLLTAHAAKGREYDHVFVLDTGDWRSRSAEERRLFYVAMTRAKQTLTLFHPAAGGNAFVPLLEGSEASFVAEPKVLPLPEPRLNRLHRALGLGDVNLGFAGAYPANSAPHRAIAGLTYGDSLVLQDGEIRSARGQHVGKLAKACKLPPGRIADVRVSAIVVRTKQQTDPQYVARVKADRWEVVLCDVLIDP